MVNYYFAFARIIINVVSMAFDLIGSGVPSESCSSVDEERTPFVNTVATFLFLALSNLKKRKARTSNLTPEAANRALFRSIQNAAGSAENILFWSSNQHLLLEGEYRHVKFSSDYGTGEHVRGTELFS